jgi:hypothetical protein
MSRRSGITPPLPDHLDTQHLNTQQLLAEEVVEISEGEPWPIVLSQENEPSILERSIKVDDVFDLENAIANAGAEPPPVPSDEEIDHFQSPIFNLAEIPKCVVSKLRHCSRPYYT